MQELIFLFSKSPVLSFCVDSYTRIQPSHLVILNNAHFKTNAIGDDWRYLFTSIWFPVWSSTGFNEGPLPQPKRNPNSGFI